MRFIMFSSASLTNGGLTLSPEEVLQQAIASGEMESEISQVATLDSDQSLLESIETSSDLDCEPGYAALDGTECATLLCDLYHLSLSPYISLSLSLSLSHSLCLTVCCLSTDSPVLSWDLRTELYL